MDNCSYFIKDKAIFGSYPNDENIKELESIGVNTFINLTEPFEKGVIQYQSNSTHIHFPIKDHYIPQYIPNFCNFIMVLSKNIYNLEKDEKIYIHCKGGHGRAGLVVACLLSYIFKINPEDAIKLTTKYHNNRKVMKDKWRKIGSPQTNKQKKFVIKLFSPFYFHGNKYINFFSTFSLHPIMIDDYNFPTVEAAYQSYKSNNKNYKFLQENAKTARISYELGNRYDKELVDNWDDIKDDLMEKIFLLKLKQYPFIKQKLLNTGFRELTENSDYDSYWGLGKDGNGENNLGKLLVKIRNNFFL